jgi:phosphate transport system substrate-binding protein
MMKNICLLIVLIGALTTANAQTTAVIKITGTKFPFYIMQQWIDVYGKTHPGVQFQLSKSIPLDSADLLIAAHAFNPGELREDEVVIALNRYAQLPIANIYRKDIAALQLRGFTTSDLKAVYFEQSDENKTDGLNEPVHVYGRDKKVCASRSFAENITGNQWSVAGTLVNGDDRALSAAVKNDVHGISYNNLGLIYDLKTRMVVDSIAVIPIDLNENGKIDDNEKIYATLDDVLGYLSTSSGNIIPQENVNIVINRKTISRNALDFVEWILTEGQRYNHSYGFLDLDKTVVKQQQQLLNGLTKDNASLK